MTWLTFVSHKVVQAAPIVEIERRVTPPIIFVDPHGSGDHEAFTPTEPAMASRAEVGGYAVIYEDGYKSISPKKAFEEGYRRQ